MLTIVTLMALTSTMLLLGAIRARAGVDDPPAARSDPAPASRSRGEVDLGRVCRDVAASLAGDAARHRVSLRHASGERISVVGDAAALGAALRGLIGASIAGHAGGAVLVSASLHGGRVQVAVLGDAPGRAPDLPDAELRHAERTIALHGGTLDVEARRCGAALTIRLLAMPAGWSDAAPASAPAVPAGAEAATRRVAALT